MLRWFCSILFVLLTTLSGCGPDETPTRLNDFTKLTSIAIECRVVKLANQTSTQLIAKGNFSGLFTRDITSQVLWKSSQVGIADFIFPTTPGRIKGSSPGVTTITATLDGIESQIDLTVSDATLTTLTVSPESPSLPKGLTQFFTVEGLFSDGSTQDMTFDATWSSSVESVATISSSPASKRVAKAVETGETNITAKFQEVTGSSTLTVTAAVPVSIKVTAPCSTLLSLKTQPYSAVATYSDDSSSNVTSVVTWKSSQAAVATITASGVVKTLSPGTATMTATMEGVVGSAPLTVTGGDLTGISLSIDQANLNNELIQGTVSRLVARGTFSNGTSRDISGAIETWTVADNTLAAITQDSGNLIWLQTSATNTGTTTLIAKYGAISSPAVTLKVLTTALGSGTLNVPEGTVSLAVGTSLQLSLSGTFSPSNNQDLTLNADWSSNNEPMATVDNIGLNKGRIHALNVGSSQISAIYGGQTATSSITIKSLILDHLTLAVATPIPTTMIPGREEKFIVTAHFTDGTTQDVTADVLWSITDGVGTENLNTITFSDPDSDPGLIVGVNAGSATLTAIFGTKEIAENIIVNSK